jgi:hypothetical protein
MRSLGTSVYLLSISVGMYMAGALNMAIAAAAPQDPWLANNTLNGHYDWWVAGSALCSAAASVDTTKFLSLLQNRSAAPSHTDPCLCTPCYGVLAHTIFPEGSLPIPRPQSRLEKFTPYLRAFNFCLCRYFFLNAGILVLGTIAYTLIARNYTEKPVVPKACGKGDSMDADEFKAA